MHSPLFLLEKSKIQKKWDLKDKVGLAHMIPKELNVFFSGDKSPQYTYNHTAYYIKLSQIILHFSRLFFFFMRKNDYCKDNFTSIYMCDVSVSLS